MSRKKVTGICKLCGLDSLLTFEHVPQQSSFNNLPVKEITYDRLKKLENLDSTKNMKGPIYQRGQGDYYLCRSCNNNTGSWYGDAYTKWAEFGDSYLDNVGRPENIIVYPLRIIKQIISNFICIRNQAYDETYKDLKAFVLNRDHVGLPERFKLYVSCTDSSMIRKSDIALNIRNQSDVFLCSEIVFCPYIYVLTIDSDCPDSRLVDISNLALYSYDDLISLKILLPCLPVNTPYPVDYRTKEEIDETIQRRKVQNSETKQQ